MSYQTRAYDNEHGDPVVVLVAEGTHDVSRLVNLLAGNRMALCEHISLAGQVRRQVSRHSGGRAALRLLAAHGGPDLLEDPSKVEAGPWVAVLADRHGDVYPTFAEAAKVLHDDAEMMIRIVRGTALPTQDEDDDGPLRVATEYNVGDLAYEVDAYLTDPDDHSQGAEVLYARAQAMADGLNAAERVPA